MNQLLVATHNQGKVKEFAELLSPYVKHISSAADHNLPEPEETGDTFEANALLKAQAAFDATGIACLADDSGLAVDALNGAPGIYSARWAETDTGRDFNKAMQKVHDELLNHQNKAAAFVCVLALVQPNKPPLTFRGIVRGTIVAKAGQNGFGYDPIFQANGYNITMAQMLTAEKQAISHRAEAFKKLIAANVL